MLLSSDEIADATEGGTDFPSFHLLRRQDVVKVDVFVLPDTEYGAKLMERARVLSTCGRP